MKDIKELREQNYALSKSVSFEEGKEETVIENPDWETELQTLIQLNINKAQWVEKYSVDTVISGNQSTITYQAFSAAIPVKRMVIKQQDGEVSEIFVSYGRRNILFTSKNQIRYIPFDSFLIKGSQKALFLSNHNYEVSGKMIRKNE